MFRSSFKISVVASILAIGLTAALSAQQKPFEGKLEAYGAGQGMTNSVVAFVKANKARIFPQKKAGPMTNGLPLIDYDAMKIVLIADKEKYYMEMPLDMMEKKLTENPLVLKPTGNKGEFLGVNAEEFKGFDKETGVEIVASGTKDIVSKLNILVSFQRISSDALAVSKTGRALLDLGFFPVKVVASKAGKVVFRWEIRNIEPGPVDPSKMQIPAGYLRFSEYMKRNTQRNRGGR